MPAIRGLRGELLPSGGGPLVHIQVPVAGQAIGTVQLQMVGGRRVQQEPCGFGRPHLGQVLHPQVIPDQRDDPLRVASGEAHTPADHPGHLRAHHVVFIEANPV